MTGAEGVAQQPVQARRGLRVALPRFYFAGILSVLGGLLLWELISRFLVANALFLAAPSQIFAAIVALAKSGELWRHLSVSAIEFALGYVIASVLGIIIGFAMAESATMKRVLQPWISGLYATPTIALAPLFILWLGIGIWSKVLVVIFLVLFPVTINTEAGLRTTSERLIEMLRSFGATPRQIFFKVSLPSAVPFILAGLKLGIGRGLIGVVVAELFGSRAGLGRLIAQSADAFNMPELFAGVVVLAAAGIVLTAGFGWLENRLVPWTKDWRHDGAQAPNLPSRQDVRRIAGAAGHHPRGRARRVHCGRRPFGLRQDHVSAHRRGARTRQLGRSRARRTRGARPGRRPRLRVPERQSFAVAHGVRQRDHRARGRGSSRPRRAAAHDGALEARRPRGLRALPSAPALGRHAPARQSRPRARHRSANPADGRAVLLARRADPRDHADGADAHLGGWAQDRLVRDPPDRRGGVFGRPRARVRAPAGPAAGECRDRVAASARARDQAHGRIRALRGSHLAADRGRRARQRDRGEGVKFRRSRRQTFVRHGCCMERSGVLHRNDTSGCARRRRSELERPI